MNSVSYRSFEDKDRDCFDKNSRASNDAPYIVNCAGFISISTPFTTHNTRGRDDYYLMYMSEGNLRMDIGDTRVTVRPGDAVIFAPKYKYRYTFSGNGTLSYYYVHFTGSHIAQLLLSLGFSELPTVCRAGHSEAALRGFSDMFDAYTQGGELRDPIISAALVDIFVALARACRASKTPTPPQSSLAFIHSFYSKDISIPELAAMEGLSVSRYNVVFKTVTGVSPIQYITDLRIRHACTLLKTTDLHVKEIGLIVGYRDNHFFSKVFKEKMGIPAQKYRKI